MLRKILQYLPFLLPFIGYAIYIVVARFAGRDASWRGAPWLWLTGAGLIFTVIALLGFRALEPQRGTGGDYVPPRLEDGRVVPGQIVPDKR
ncbi:MAG: DUF6111 family protein [Proteobacteria bacterium]|nr:DUF6111 family protein [Pseudomonadota bacterium]